MQNFADPLIQGLTQGMQLRQMIEDHQMHREAMMRSRINDQREASLQDLNTRLSLLSQGEAPVDKDGNYQKTLQGSAPDLASAKQTAAPVNPPPAASGPQTATGLGPLPAPGTLAQSMSAVKPTPQMEAPPSLTLPTGGADLANTLSMPGQRINVPAEAAQTVTAPSGQKYRMPTKEEREAEADRKAQRAAQGEIAKKKLEEQVTMPDGSTVDQRALPTLTARENAAAVNARADKTIAATSKEKGLDRENAQTIAGLNQQGQNDREKFTHGENALNRAAKAAQDAKNDASGDKPQTATPAQLSKLEADKKRAETKAETVYGMRANQERNRAAKVNPKSPDKVINKGVMDAAEEERAKAYQAADDTYSDGLTKYGQTPNPIDYMGRLAARRAGGQQPAAGKAPAQQAAQPQQAAPAQQQSAAPKQSMGSMRRSSRPSRARARSRSIPAKSNPLLSTRRSSRRSRLPNPRYGTRPRSSARISWPRPCSRFRKPFTTSWATDSSRTFP